MKKKQLFLTIFFCFLFYGCIQKLPSKHVQTGRIAKKEILYKNDKLLSYEEYFYDPLGYEEKKVIAKTVTIESKKDLIGRVLYEERSKGIRNCSKINEVHLNPEKGKSLKQKLRAVV